MGQYFDRKELIDKIDYEIRKVKYKTPDISIGWKQGYKSGLESAKRIIKAHKYKQSED